ncbi:hypothetical protein [Flavobacterium sp. KACC 22761]|uniref:hypothetical protein n=1 Tax=Flavobacterium sp. KACC 22761 TaxID=3092665 RepID=UPI002A7564EC|nr:hypothetical protein [Flavobacterium sp. KACC 22761]WPO78638.1 hypothetical protein SCB73_20480 [Flavobacterium sp. KACC 22761]
MNLTELEDRIKNNYYKLIYKSSYVSSASDKSYVGTNLIELRQALKEFEGVEIIDNELNLIKSTSLFSSYNDEEMFTSKENMIIDKNVEAIRIGLEFLLRYKIQITKPDHGLYIKLPEVINFEDLSKVANDLKKSIEIPINDQQDGGYVQIQSAESGSIWLLISVGTISAVNLIGGICWAAAVLRKKKAEAKIFEEHARTLELKNDGLAQIIEAQKQQYKNILQAEAEEIANKNFNNNSPEVIERLKLSLTTTADLIDRGTKILPSSDKELSQSFPNYSNLDLIESAIKKIANN